jgi:hypothetical protein
LLEDVEDLVVSLCAVQDGVDYQKGELSFGEILTEAFCRVILWEMSACPMYLVQNLRHRYIGSDSRPESGTSGQ